MHILKFTIKAFLVILFQLDRYPLLIYAKHGYFIVKFVIFINNTLMCFYTDNVKIMIYFTPLKMIEYNIYILYKY